MPKYTVKYGDTLSGIARANGTTVQALMAANPNIKDPNRISAGGSLNLSGTMPKAPTVTATTTTTPTTTPTSTPVTQNPLGTPTQPPKPQTTIMDRVSQIPDMNTGVTDPTLKAYYQNISGDLTKPINESAVREEVRKRFNDQYEALRLAALQKKQEVYKEGEGRMGSARALQARSGVLGSSFSQSENNQITDATKAQADLIDAETESKIAYLMGQAETDASDQIAKQRAALKGKADDYIKYIETRDSQRVSQANSLAKMFAAQGIDPNTLTKDDVSKLENTYGVNLQSFKQMINDARSTITKENSFDLSDGQAKYRINPTTGQAELIAENTKNFAPSKYNSGGGTISTGTRTMSSGGGSATRTDLDALIDNVATGISAKNQRETFYSSIKKARNDQDKIATVASALKIAGPAREDLTQTAQGQNNLRQAVKLLEGGVKTGVFQSGANYGFNLVGGQVDPKLTQLKQYITAAIQPYRSSVTGAAWGPQEEAEYSSMFGSIKDTPETLLTKLKNLDNIMTGKRVSIISSYADPMGAYGSTFDSYYQQGNQAPVVTNTEPTVRMKSPSGEVRNVPSSSVSSAAKAGYIKI